MSLTKDQHHDALQEPWNLPEAYTCIATYHESVPLETRHGTVTVPREALRRAATTTERNEGVSYAEDEIAAAVAERVARQIEVILDEVQQHGVGNVYYLLRASEQRHAA